jgi:solute carrier family 25 (mitochondrial folate transporter), member 32
MDWQNERTMHTVASQVAGALSTFAVAPLDTVRYRYMAQDGTAARTNNGKYYTRLTESVRVILKEEGPRALYRGAHVGIAGASASWGIYMYTYRTGQAASAQSGFGGNFFTDSVVSTGASLLNACVTCPIWLIKTRMQVEDATKGLSANAEATATPRHYRTFTGGVRHVVTSEGVPALWRGLRMQLAMSATNGVYLPLYEVLKRYTLRLRSRETLDSWEIILCSTVSKSVIAFVTNPLFVIRTRLQDARSRSVPGVEYISVGQSARMIYRREALGGFFRGVVPSVALTAPRAALCMVLMEELMAAFRANASKPPSRAV